MPYIQEPIPLVSTPPMSQWSMLQLPWTGEVTEIKHVNMRNLRELYCDYTPLASLPWNELGALQYLYVYGTALATLELWQMPNLYSCYASDNYNLVTVDAHDAPTLSDLDVAYCQSLLTLNVLGCSNLRYIYAYGAALPQVAVDQVLSDLVTNGATSGYLQINGPYNAPPSDPDGLAQKAILISRGWTIYHS
jgi:hypothetical protein